MPAKMGWVPQKVGQMVLERSQHLAQMSLKQLDDVVGENMSLHKSIYDDSICLEGATNVPNPRLLDALGHSIGFQPSLGHPFAKHERGMQGAEQIELVASTLLCRLFGASYAEPRPVTGSQAVTALRP